MAEVFCSAVVEWGRGKGSSPSPTIRTLPTEVWDAV